MAYRETSQATIKYQTILFKAGDEAEPSFKIHHSIYYVLVPFWPYVLYFLDDWEDDLRYEGKRQPSLKLLCLNFTMTQSQILDIKAYLALFSLG